MNETLIRGAHVWQHGQVDVRVVGNRIDAIGQDLATHADTHVLDAAGQLLYPGLVNTHHHIAQSLFKAMPGGVNAGLNEWLAAVPYTVWPLLTPDSLYIAARIGFAELLRAGCTTCADHHYLYHADTSPAMEEAVFQAASEIGIRLLLCRGGNSVAGTHRGFSSTTLVPESMDVYLQRLQDTVAKWHDPAPDAMTRIAVAPTSLVHSHKAEHLRDLAAFAKSYGLKRHSHLLEVPHDNEAALASHGLRAVDYAASVDWLGSDVWYAHLVHADAADIAQLAATGTGIAHCPTSNCRLGSGVAPVVAMADAGVPVSLGVDGSASAESGSLIAEMNLCWLLHRAVHGPDATEAQTVVHWATRSGAELMGFSDTGVMREGMLADLVLYDLNQPRFHGVWDDALAPVYCGEPVQASAVMVNGEWRLRDGAVSGLDTARLGEDAAQEVSRLKAAL